jgi:RNA polymerase sigma-70 factor, ECF subfamily
LEDLGLPAPTDQALIVRTLDGDLDAFDGLVRRHRGHVLGVARGVLHDSESAEDAAQEALVEAYRSLRSLRDPVSFPAWLATIARRVATRALYRQSAQEQRLGGWAEPPMAGPAEAHVAERAREALAELSARHRQVMVLHYLQGFGCAEIGARLGLPEGTVKRILHEARAHAREECGAMPKAPQAPVRRLYYWINGSYDCRVPRNIFAIMDTALPETICLCVSKRAKSLEAISREVGAQEAYVADHLGRLVTEEIITKEDGRYRANFVALEAAEWLTLTKDVRQLGRQGAKVLAPHLPRLEAAFRKAPVSRKWPWEEIIWHVVGLFVSGRARGHKPPATQEVAAPLRASTGRYWFAGYERPAREKPHWTNGFNMWDSGDPKQLCFGFYWTYGLTRRWFPGRNDAGQVLWALAHGGCRTAEEAAEHVGGGLPRAQEIAAQWVAGGLLVRKRGRLQLNIPLFEQGDKDALEGSVTAAGREMAERVLWPLPEVVGARLRGFGYGHLVEQFPTWSHSVGSYVLGEAVHALLRQGLLPRPDDPPPTRFGFLAWEPEVGLPG